ncbi:MAG: hypothetical protein PHW01_03735 [Patescibacteria group bacterium]|nr:hypothetical protein [Patescibacteria group bacterium]
MPNNARRKRKNRYLGLGNSLKKKYTKPSHSDGTKGSGKKDEIYSLYITDVAYRGDIYSVAVLIQNITGWTGTKAEDCSSNAYRGISNFIASSGDEKKVEDWKRQLENAGATVSIKTS